MKVFYCGNGDIIAPLTAALIHMEFLPRERLPSLSEITGRLNEYDIYEIEAGIPFFIGSDIQGNQIYCINLKNTGNLGFQVIEGVIGSEMFGKWSFRNCPKQSHWLIPAGKILVNMKKKHFGKTLIGKGIRKDYFNIVKTYDSATGNKQ